MTKKVNGKQKAVVAPPAVTGNAAIDTALQDVTNGMGSVDGLLGQVLSHAERQHLAKVRRDGMKLAGTLIGLASRTPGLAPPGLDLAALTSELVEVDQLRQLQLVVGEFGTRLSDSVVVKQAQIWTAALTIYGIAEHWKGNGAGVSEAVAQIKAALATGPRLNKDGTPKKPKKSKKTPPATTASPAPTDGSTASTGPATNGTGNGTQQVPVYGPNGPEGTAPATNPAKAGS